MSDNHLQLDFAQCQRARLARDRRFDGLFFVAVKSTGIFCRPVCPARMPKEENVEYFADKAQALQAGYRPCLRCRPDSAPGSWAWRGAETTFSRAVRLIDDGALQQQSLAELAQRLGISDRYLRQLFQRHLGMSPKQYALYQQLLFAKQLLHVSNMSVTDIGFAAGFNSTRRFNDAFRRGLQLSPSQVRRSLSASSVKTGCRRLLLTYAGRLNWQHMLDFYRLRAINSLEMVDESSYARHVLTDGKLAWFKASHCKSTQIALDVELEDMRQLRSLVRTVRRLFDLDADTDIIEQHLEMVAPGIVKSPGIRIPGVWSVWEAGVRAILGQQVSVKAAVGLLNQLVAHFNDTHGSGVFPTACQLASADLNFLRMPASRIATLERFARFFSQHPDSAPGDWLQLKGIGPWTVNYVLLRGLSKPDCFLDSDLVVKKALQNFPGLNAGTVSPWGSYATFHLWNQ